MPHGKLADFIFIIAHRYVSCGISEGMMDYVKMFVSYVSAAPRLVLSGPSRPSLAGNNIHLPFTTPPFMYIICTRFSSRFGGRFGN